MSRKPIANPLLDVDGYIDPVNLINPYAFAAAGGSFDPLSISGCVLWLKADGSCYNTGTTQATDGQTVATWVDASTAGNNATESTNKPVFKTNIVNAKPVIRFDSPSSSKMGGDVSISGTSLTAFSVATITSGSATNGRILSMSGAYGAHDYNISGSAAAILRDGSAQGCGGYRVAMKSKHSITYGAFFVGASKFDGTNHTFYKDGTAATPASSSGTFSIAKYRIGTSTFPADFLTGDIAELLVYNSALGTTDREAVEDYLGAKYGITIA